MSSFDAKISWYSDLQIVWVAKVMDFDDLSHRPTEESSTGFLARGAKFKCFVFGNPYKLGVFFHLGEWSFPTFCYLGHDFVAQQGICRFEVSGWCCEDDPWGFQCRWLNSWWVLWSEFWWRWICQGQGYTGYTVAIQSVIEMLCLLAFHPVLRKGPAVFCMNTWSFVSSPHEGSYQVLSTHLPMFDQETRTFQSPCMLRWKILRIYNIYIYICVVHVVGSQNVRCAKERRRNSTSQNKRPCALGTWQPFLV